MLASRDEWFSPIVAKVGPDGYLWVIDWYNLVIQHNPTPADFEMGEGNAYETPLRDREHARIYRVVPEGGESSYEVARLSEASPGELVETLTSDNLFWRLTAQRLLVERGEQDVVEGLYALVRNPRTDALGLAPGALHALWTLHGLGGFDGENDEALEVGLEALHHSAAGVRRAALMVLPRTEGVREAILDGGMLPDPETPGAMDYAVAPGVQQEADALVRLEALLALSQMPRSERAARAVAEAARVEENVTDKWLRAGLIAAGAQQEAAFLEAVLAGGLPEEASEEFRAGLEEVVRTVGGHLAATGEAAERREQLETLARDWGLNDLFD